MNHETYEYYCSNLKIGNEFSELSHFQQIFVDIP
jgi:hypothetical protein